MDAARRGTLSYPITVVSYPSHHLLHHASCLVPRASYHATPRNSVLGTGVRLGQGGHGRCGLGSDGVECARARAAQRDQHEVSLLLMLLLVVLLCLFILFFCCAVFVNAILVLGNMTLLVRRLKLQICLSLSGVRDTWYHVLVSWHVCCYPGRGLVAVVWSRSGRGLVSSVVIFGI